MQRPPLDIPLAVVGGRLLTGLLDVTDDVACLDGHGYWAVVVEFDGTATCARFDRVRPAVPWPGQPWVGPDPRSWASSLDAAQFAARVQAIRWEIAAGDVYQVNLTRRLSAPVAADADIAALGAVLSEGHPAPYSAVVRLPAHGLALASASPERFLRRDGVTVVSSPIKGTGRDESELGDKDRAENVMIVDLVRNDLGRIAEVGSVHVPALWSVEHHPGLVHLVSTVEARLRPGLGWADLLEAAFPPGSVTGAPKLAALASIARHEPVARGPYCGAVGWVDADRRQGDLNVAIRTFWITDQMLHFGTGGAITWDSDPDDEWRETELKADRLLRLATGPAVPA